MSIPERLGQLGRYYLTQHHKSGYWCRTWYDEATKHVRTVSLGTTDLERAKLALYQWYLTYELGERQEPESALWRNCLPLIFRRKA
jgi:hypothetical protein